MSIETCRHLKIFKFREFLTKFMIKLLKNYGDPILVCMLTLKLSRKNRKLNEVDFIIPFLNKFPNLMRLLEMNGPDAKPQTLLREFGFVSFYSYCEKHSIVRRPLEKENNFFLLLSGSILVLNVKYEKYGLTKEEYLTYLIKLRLLNEINLFEQCSQFNQNILEINKNFIEKMPKIKYDIYASKAKAEIYSYRKNTGLNNKDIVPSIAEYMKIIYPCKSNGLIEREAKTQFMIPIYEEVNKLYPGDYFGSLIPVESNSSMYLEKDYRTYLALSECDLSYINVRVNTNEPRTNEAINKKLKRTVHKDFLSKYYIFQSIEKEHFDQSYSKLFSYRIAKKGERIILQGSLADGVYLLLKGTFEISMRRSFDELDAVIVQLKQSLDNFNETIMDNFSKKKKTYEETNEFSMINASYSNADFAHILQQKRKIILNHITTKEAMGLNDYYDYKTKLNFFNVECISDMAEILFIQREAFLYLFKKETLVKIAALKLIENKIQYYIESIRRYRIKVNSEAGVCYNNSNKIRVNPYNKFYKKQEINLENNNAFSNLKSRTINQPNTILYHSSKSMCTEPSKSNFETDSLGNTPGRRKLSNKLPLLQLNNSSNTSFQSPTLPNNKTAEISNQYRSTSSQHSINMKDLNSHKTITENNTMTLSPSRYNTSNTFKMI